MKYNRNLEIIFNRIKNETKDFVKIFSSSFPKRMKLYSNKQKYIITKDTPTERFFYTEEEKKKYSNEHDKYFCYIIEKFVTTIQEINPNFDLSNFYSKFDDIMFYDIKSSGVYIGGMYIHLGGFYSSMFNVIVNREHSDNKDKVVTHELLHAASSKNCFLFGFHNGLIRTGRWLNEGYTELLNNRYFDSSFGFSYPSEVFLMNKLEHIIGKEKMEQLYINSDLKGLINEINKYLSKKQTWSFIRGKNISKRLLYLQKMSINKSKNENKPIDNLFISQIQSVFSTIQNRNLMKKILGIYIPGKSYISLLQSNLSNNDESNINELSTKKNAKVYSKKRGFATITALITLLSIILVAVIIFIIINNHLI